MKMEMRCPKCRGPMSVTTKTDFGEDKQQYPFPIQVRQCNNPKCRYQRIKILCGLPENDGSYLEWKAEELLRLCEAEKRRAEAIGSAS